MNWRDEQNWAVLFKWLFLQCHFFLVASVFCVDYNHLKGDFVLIESSIQARAEKVSVYLLRYVYARHSEELQSKDKDTGELFLCQVGGCVALKENHPTLPRPSSQYIHRTMLCNVSAIIMENGGRHRSPGHGFQCSSTGDCQPRPLLEDGWS